MIDTVADTFVCPGERHPISRAVHLGRLLAGHAGCLDCPLRDDATPLTHAQVEALERHREAKRPEPIFQAEGIEGRYLNTIDARVTRQLAMAHTKSTLQHQLANANECSVMLVAHDGRGLSAEIAAAAAEGYLFFGADAGHHGATTSAQLAAAIIEQQATGGMFVGNATGETAHVSLRLFGPAGQPLSASPGASQRTRFGGGLETVEQAFRTTSSRPVRQSGRELPIAVRSEDSQQSLVVEQPFALVLDTSNRELRRQFELLGSNVRAHGIERGLAEYDSDEVQRDDLGCTVMRRQADLGVWIDGHGERCRFVDEQGQVAPPELIAALLAARFIDTSERPEIVLAGNMPREIVELLKRVFRVRRGQLTCEAMFARLSETEAIFGATADGHYWFRQDTSHGELPVMDAALATHQLLDLLASTDESLSALLDRVRRQAYDR